MISKLLQRVSLFLIIGIMLNMLTGCGMMTDQIVSSATNMNNHIRISNATTERLNTLMSQITDKQSAKKATEEVAEYLGSRLEGNSVNNIATMKNLINVDAVANAEHQLRVVSKMSVQSDGQDNTAGSYISVDEITSKLDQKSDVSGNPFSISKENVAAIRDGVRESMPNIAVDSTNDKMSPLEAVVVS